jgi:prepilin-type N-terminal cleavage/methylation domain-containing protein
VVRVSVNTFQVRIRERIKAHTSGDLRIATLFLLMNSPAVVAAAEQYSNGLKTYTGLLTIVAEAYSSVSRRFDVDALQIAEAVAAHSSETAHAGFTLVELSIVLVIIGLLIGGILAAQSMISTSKVVAVAAQIQQFDAGVENFKTKYNYLPGDAPAFGGDGDGLIDTTAAIADNANSVFACEIANFWNNFDLQSYTGSICGPPGAKPTTAGAAKNVPLSKFGAKGAFVTASSLSVDGGCYADSANRRSYYSILDASEAQNLSVYSLYHFNSTSATNSAVKPNDLLALDAKMDDGVASSGNVLSGSIGNCVSNVGGIVANPLPNCSDGSGAYQVQNSGYECTPLIRIGAQAGEPQ